MPRLYELTQAQKRIWYLEQIHPCTPINNIGGFVRIKGDICFQQLQRAIHSTIQTHQSLRTKITKRNEKPFQYLDNWIPKIFPTYDFSLYPHPENEFNQWVFDEGSKPFSLYDNFLYYFALFRLGNSETGYLIKIHHILSDMWSISILTNEIKKYYESNQSTRSVASFNFFDYTVTEKAYLESQRYKKDNDFWTNSFNFKFSTDVQKPSNFKTRRNVFTYDENLTKKIHHFIVKEQLSLNTLFIALMGIYFFLKKNRTDLLIALPVLNRTSAKEKKMVGMFINTLPFHLKIHTQLSGIEFLQSIKKNLRQCYFHHKYPYNSLFQELRKKDIDLSDIIQTSVNFYPASHPHTFVGFRVQNEEFFSGYQIYPLHIVINEWKEHQLQVYFDYHEESYNEEEIISLIEDFNDLLSNLILEPIKKLSDFTLGSKQPQKYLFFPYKNFQSASTPINPILTVVDLFEEQAKQNSLKIAIQDGMNKISYSDLKLKIDQLAQILKQRIQGQAIAIMGDPSPESLICIFAVLKLGYPYVPIGNLETDYQIHQILKDAQVKTLLIWSDENTSRHLECETLDVRILLKMENPVKSCLASQASPTDLAYIIYTSGSTGVPKGVKVSHSNLMAYLDWAKIYIKHENAVVAFFTAISFDLTITSIFLPLIHGCKIKIFRSKDSYALLSIVQDQEITVLKATPSHLHLIEDRSFSSSNLKTMIVGGEDLKVFLAKKIQMNFGKNLSIYNEYGPTETTVGCMIHRFDSLLDVKDSVPIGSAAGTVQLLVLNNDKQLVGIGETGELYVGGEQVTQGYLNRQELTDQQFVRIPAFSQIFYKTGDLVSQNNQNLLFFRGRKDDQIKINGYRIELGEIQTCFLKYEGIKNAHVLPVQMYDKSSLAAFFASNEKINLSQLSTFLAQRLPPYKIPQFILQLENIPLTPHGKIDQFILKELIKKSEFQEKTSLTIEEKTLEIFREALKHNIDSLDANFFQLGGDSILAIQISSKLASQGINLPVKNILSSATIKEILLDAKKQITHHSLKPAKGAQPLASTLQWFFKQPFKYPHFYHQSVLISLKFMMRIDRLEDCLTALVNSHDSLRLNYKFAQQTLFYNNRLQNEKINISVHDFRSLDDQTTHTQLTNIAYSMKDKTNIANEHLLSAAIIFNNKSTQDLLLCIHHIGVDGVSWRILLDDLNTFLKSARDGMVVSPKPKKNSFQAWMCELIKTPNHVSDDFKHHFSEIPISLIDYNTSQNKISRQLEFSIPIGDFHIVNLKENSNDTEFSNLLTTAYLLTISQLFLTSDILMTFEHHGRFALNSSNNNDVVGWFTVMCPLHFILSKDISQVIRNVKKVLSCFFRNAPSLSLSNPFIEKYPTPYRFNYLGNVKENYSEFNINELCIGPESHPENHKPSLDLNVYRMNHHFKFLLSFSNELFSQPEVFVQVFKNNFQAIMNAIQNKEIYTYQASDFDTVILEEDELKELLF